MILERFYEKPERLNLLQGHDKMILWLAVAHGSTFSTLLQVCYW